MFYILYFDARTIELERLDISYVFVNAVVDHADHDSAVAVEQVDHSVVAE